MDKIDKLASELEKATTDADKTKLTSMKAAAELELSYAQENLKNSFADGIALFKEHQQTVSVELSDLGARMNRLSMIKDRLEQQSLTVEELKSKNEDTDLTSAAVEYNAMEDVYDASLSTAAKIVQKSLLDFI
jgi:flagellin-like hook-associated protein FlgL